MPIWQFPLLTHLFSKNSSLYYYDYFSKWLHNLCWGLFLQILLGVGWNDIKCTHYFPLFINSINIYWTPTMCQAVLYILSISEQVKQDHYSWGAYILVSVGGGEIDNK